MLFRLFLSIKLTAYERRICVIRTAALRTGIKRLFIKMRYVGFN